MRSPSILALVVALSGCGAAAVPATAPNAPNAEAQALPAPLAISGEQLVWSVWWQGAQIGTATLETTPDGSRAEFATSGLASLVGKMRYEQSTHARSTTEDLVASGDHQHRVVALDRVSVPGGTPLHTLASTLGAVRAWASRDATHAFAWVVVDGELYRLDVAAPAADDGGLRVDATVRPLDPHGDGVALSVWLDGQRVPVRFAVLARGERITAQLTASTAGSVAKTGR